MTLGLSHSPQICTRLEANLKLSLLMQPIESVRMILRDQYRKSR